MDEPGFHARRRAELEQRAAARDGKLGLHGIKATEPLQNREELRQQVSVPEARDESVAGSYQEVGYRPPATVVNADEIPGPKPVTGTVPTVEPLDRPHIRGMKPQLQMMTGVMLRYDTTVNNVWHGFAMIVTSDGGSDYSQRPQLALEWDATSGAIADRLANVHISELPRRDPSGAGKEEGVHSLRLDGQQIYTYYSVAGGQTFWRFKIEIPLGEREEEIFYSLNGGPESSFWVPAFDQEFRVMYHSCNGFSSGVDTDSFNGPDPLWRDVLRKHEEKPIHVMVGGGDQIYCDPLTREPEIAPWITETDVSVKIAAPLTDEMKLALDRFFFNWYCAWFRGGAFGVAVGKIPMLNMLDDHDMIDGFGSYPDDLQQSPVFSAIGAAGYKWFLLFQMFIVDEMDGTRPETAVGIAHVNTHPSKSLIIGGDGAFIPFPNHSFLSYLGPKMYILMIDWRGERRKDQLASKTTYERCERAVDALPAGVEHLVVLLGVPIAYPRMTAIETVLESKFNPMSLLAKAKIMPSAVNKFNAEAELKDDLADHPCAGDHKKERNWLMERFQHMATSKHIRISIMSGDVHASANSKFCSTKKVAPAKDPKYMLQIISSAIVNTPPPPAVIWLVTKLGQKRHKTLHYIDTDEELIPLFEEDTDGSKPKSNTVMGRRNYCMADYDTASDDLQFTLCVEKSQGSGTTKEYAIRAPPPRW
ncbi:uncharacterized protein JCM10292_007447 [Rhodotorula paludigena]|uniref:uncharacterized protein n=1 Tax=Rhodotorula paludigena TaxID=86838 RepID=UPI00316F104F